MKILVPIDFSRTADKALQYAVDNFTKRNVRFFLYHAFMPFKTGFYSYKTSNEENAREMAGLKAALMEKVKNLKARHTHANIQFVIDHCTEEKGILQYARKIEADLIIMGTTGATGLKQKLVGSVTANVMNKASCAVIGVPQKYKPGILKEVVFCTNYQLNDIDAIKKLLKLVKSFKANIRVWHFSSGDISLSNAMKQSSDYELMMRKQFRSKSISFHFARTSDLQHALGKLSKRKDIDLISMVTHRRKGLFSSLLNRSLTKVVACHTKVPLLSIPYQTGNY